MKFSVIIPVYNVEAYLEKCLDSVIKQTFMDYEIIIVDDESTDSSGQIAEEYAKKDARIHVIHQKNKRQGGARNTGIANAKGEYLIFVDSDDYVAHTLLETVNFYLEKTNPDILVYDYVEVSEDERILTKKKSTGDCREIKTEEFMLLAPCVWNKAFRRTLFLENQILFPEKIWFEDMTADLQLGLVSSKTVIVNEILYFYRQRQGSTMQCTNIERVLEIMQAFQLVLDFYKKEKKDKIYEKELEWLCFQHVLYYPAFRLLSQNYHVREMKILQEFCKERFPDLKQNSYLKQVITEDLLTKQIMEGRFFGFYLKIGARNKIKSYVKSRGNC